MDLNLYLGLPPLPRPPGRLGAAMDCPAPAPAQLPDMPVAEAPRTGEPEEVQPAVYSPSNALSMPELSTPELSLIDPMIIDWLDGLTADGEEALSAGEPAAVLDALSGDANVSQPVPAPLLAGLEGVRLEWVERLSHPAVVPPAVPGEMISTTPGRGGGTFEEMTPELRLQRLIQVSEQHRIGTPGPVTRNQRATSPGADRLLQAIKRSHNSLGTSKGAVNDEICECNSSFDCNICLEAAKEPVVTPCGHLFCWPCLYQWLHGYSVHSECPICKGEVLEVNVTPIYGRSDDERGASNNDIPPRPRANRTESLRQQLQTQDPRGIANMVRRLIENQDTVRAHSAAPAGGVEVTVLPAARPRARVRRQQRQDNLNSRSPILGHPGNTASPTLQHGSNDAPQGGNEVTFSPVVLQVGNMASPTLQHGGNDAPQGGNQVTLPSSSADNVALAIPQQSSSMEQASTSSTVAVIVGQAAQSRRSRPSEYAISTRRTRRRQQQQ